MWEMKSTTNAREGSRGIWRETNPKYKTEKELFVHVTEKEKSPEHSSLFHMPCQQEAI